MSVRDMFYVSSHSELEEFVKEYKKSEYHTLRHWIINDMNQELMRAATKFATGWVSYAKNEIPPWFLPLSNEYDRVFTEIQAFFIELGYAAEYKNDTLTITFDQTPVVCSNECCSNNQNSNRND